MNNKKPKVFISIVSHGHSELIQKNMNLDELSKYFYLIIKSNKENDLFDIRPNVDWIDEHYGLGFGENNNYIYNYCCNILGMTENDFFIVCNPDVIIKPDVINDLIESMLNDSCMLASINLFKDSDYNIHDYSIRNYPTLKVFIKSFLGLGNSTLIDKEKIKSKTYVDWAAGSFLAFKASHYGSLNGFDTRFFMYCEDIDICFRSQIKGVKLLYYPDLKAIHLAQHNNRKILSKHMFWHITSALKFLLLKHKKSI
ncbi:glycosyltransferase family protein [Photobacterium damselae]|uniref:glycosyltransferase family 2 protein n=1 Tax=Photobacterium damselae TaxID=38293 RepID=UPI00370A81AB